MAGYMPPYSYPAYGGYSPVQTYMPRMDVPQYPQQSMQQPIQAASPQGNSQASPPMQIGYQCRPVTSREEAVAVQAEYFGAGTIMPDLGHGMIYLKRFNPNTGASDFFDFSVVQPTASDSASEPPPPPPDYSEAFRALGQQLEGMSSRIDDLAEKLGIMQT